MSTTKSHLLHKVTIGLVSFQCQPNGQAHGQRLGCSCAPGAPGVAVGLPKVHSGSVAPGALRGQHADVSGPRSGRVQQTTPAKDTQIDVQSLEENVLKLRLKAWLCKGSPLDACSSETQPSISSN